MGKHSGAANYKMCEMVLLNEIVAEMIPSGRDDWDALEARYNSMKAPTLPFRDFESLRRKFKQLYSTPKPTGNPVIPPHILRAKQLKREIDIKEGIMDGNDGADKDPDSECSVPLAQSHDVSVLDEAASLESLSNNILSRYDYEDSGGSLDTDSILTASSSALSRINESSTQQTDELGDIAPDDNSSQRFEWVDARPVPITTMSQVVSSDALRQRNEDAAEAAKYPTLKTSSIRLGGVDLGPTPELKRGKRSLESGGKEASFVKQRKLRAESTITTLKNKMVKHEEHSTRNSRDVLELMILMREDAERRAAERREEEEGRRRDEAARLEAAARREREEREERRHKERIEMDERRREDREESRQRAQELLLLIGAILKK